MLDGVQLVRGRVAALAGELPLGVVGAGAARDVDVAAAEVTAPLQGRRGRTAAVYDDARGEKVCVLRSDTERRPGSGGGESEKSDLTRHRGSTVLQRGR